MTTGYSSEHATFPRWPYVLSLIAGALILMEGVIVAIAGTAYTVYSFGAGVTALAIGITGVMFGIVAILAGTRLRTSPGGHVVYGAIVLVISILALVVMAGGFLVGSIMGMTAGIWAILWRT